MLSAPYAGRGVLQQPRMGGLVAAHTFANSTQAQAIVIDWCHGFYNHQRRHSTIGNMSFINYEQAAAPTVTPRRKPSTIWGNHTPRGHLLLNGPCETASPLHCVDVP